MKLSPSLFWCLIVSSQSKKKKTKKKIRALFFLFLVWCQWCFSALRYFRAAENLSLAYWIEFFWLLISELLLLFAVISGELELASTASVNSSCLITEKGERGGPGRFWGTQAHQNMYDRKKQRKTGLRELGMKLGSSYPGREGAWAWLKSCETASMHCWDPGGWETFPCWLGLQRNGDLQSWSYRAEIPHALCWIKSLPWLSGGIKSLLWLSLPYWTWDVVKNKPESLS